MFAKIFRKHYLLTAFILILFIFLGYLSSFAYMRYSHRAMQGGSPPVFFAKLIDRLNAQDRVAALKELESMDEHHGPFRFVLLSDEGKVLYPDPEKVKLPFRWNEIPHPKLAYEHISILPLPHEHQPLGAGPAAPGMPPPGFGPGPGGPGMPPGGPGEVLIRFNGEAAQYLYVQFMQGPSPFFHDMLINSSILLVSILLGAGFSLLILFRSLQGRVELVDYVISELQRGNLKARFPIKKMDEFGAAMQRFNQMAEEIERLVEQLRSVEKVRMNILQELAHDLRTPVASMKNLLETSQRKSDSMSPSLRQELLELSLKEVDYFERLVEDLLILAQVSEPRYHVEQKSIFLNELLEEESESVAQQYAENKKIRLKKDFPEEPIEVVGDLHLLRRMFRNALDNAFSFARAEVGIFLRVSKEGKVEVTIEDDGPGMSQKALDTFGERRVSRALGTAKEGRLSVGLGSVIMKTVAYTHRGSIEVKNKLDADGKNAGALVQIHLQKASS